MIDRNIESKVLKTLDDDASSRLIEKKIEAYTFDNKKMPIIY